MRNVCDRFAWVLERFLLLYDVCFSIAFHSSHGTRLFFFKLVDDVVKYLNRGSFGFAYSKRLHRRFKYNGTAFLDMYARTFV